MARFFILMIWLGALITCPARADDPMLIKLGFNDASAFPYFAGTGSELADPPGLSVDLILHVAARQGIDIQFERMPGMRVLHSLGVGKLDGAFIFSHRQEREAFGAYPMRDGLPDPDRRLATLGYILYVKRGTSIPWDGETFQNFQGRIGANLNYSVVHDLRNLGVNVVEGRSTEHSFRMLLAGRVDAVADQEVIADAFLEGFGHPELIKIQPPLSEKPYFLMFSHQFMKSHATVAQRFWNDIAETRDEFMRAAAHRYSTP